MSSSPLLMFVTPIVSRRYAKDWSQINQTLEKTVGSLLKQTSGDWRLLVCGGDKPEIADALKERILFVRADIDIDRPDVCGRREVDKERKQYSAYVALAQHQPEYVMPLDYDDLVNVNLVEYVSRHKRFDAFLLKRGYVYDEHIGRCYYSRRLFMRTGSNIVVRYSDCYFPTNPLDMNNPPPSYREWPFVQSHVKDLDGLCERLGLTSCTAPFPAVAWRRHQDAISVAFSNESKNTSGSLAVIKRFMLRRRVGRSFKKRFGLDVMHEVDGGENSK